MRRVVLALALALVLGLAAGLVTDAGHVSAAAGCQEFGHGIAGSAQKNVPYGQIVSESPDQAANVEQGKAKACGEA